MDSPIFGILGFLLNSSSPPIPLLLTLPLTLLFPGLTTDYETRLLCTRLDSLLLGYDDGVLVGCWELFILLTRGMVVVVAGGLEEGLLVLLVVGL